MVEASRSKASRGVSDGVVVMAWEDHLVVSELDSMAMRESRGPPCSPYPNLASAMATSSTRDHASLTSFGDKVQHVLIIQRRFTLSTLLDVDHDG